MILCSLVISNRPKGLVLNGLVLTAFWCIGVGIIA